MPSVAALLLAAGLMRVPFAAALEVRVPSPAAVPASGTVVGDFLVLASRDDGVVTLRPLALGELDVPIAGARPPRVEVDAAISDDARPAPPLIPEAPPFPWAVAAAAAASIVLAALAFRLGLRGRRRDPLAELERSLRPLAAPGAWSAEDTADRLARTCRRFLAATTAAPCGAMTTRELSRLIAARTEAALAAPFALALVLADEARFAGSATPPEAATEVVRRVLAAAPAVALACGGRR